jgi:ABC-2 type transport system permease protein
MRSNLNRLFNLRLWSLFVKEFHQIRRNRRLVDSADHPADLEYRSVWFALNPTFENLRLGVVDYSRTAESRELVSAFQEGLVFQTQAYYASANELGDAISRGDLDAGLVVPRDFAEKRARRETVEVQLLVDAVNANTATIAGGYAGRIIAGLNQKIALSQSPERE